MTVSELYNHVAKLGFEDSVEDNDVFYNAANRAIFQIAAIRPAVSSVEIIHEPATNLLAGSFDTVTVGPGKEAVYLAQGARAYYFESSGTGVCRIEKLDGEEYTVIGIVNFNKAGAFHAYRGFILDEGEPTDSVVRLRFSGDYTYMLRRVAMYSELYGPSESDILAYEPFTPYDISAMRDDFLSLASPPITDDTARAHLRGYKVENGRVILLPHDARGTYDVQYRRRPAKIQNTDAPEEQEDIIDLDEDLCSLLPVLTAAYVWADDEPEKSEYYLALYRERAAETERAEAKKSSLETVPFRNNYGW